MMQIQVKKASLEQVKRMLIQLGANVRKEVATVINKTAKQVKIPASRELGKILPVPSKTLKKTIGQKRRANDRRLEAVLIMRDGYDFPLRFFKPKTSGDGLKVQLDKRIKGKAGKTHVAGAFIVKKFGGDVFMRVGEKIEMKGKRRMKRRQKIKKQFSGVTPGQAFKDANIATLIEREVKEQLPKQLNERMRYLLLKSRGELKGKQK